MLVQEDAYFNFINSLKSDVTRKIYEYNIRLFMDFCGINNFENLIGQQNQIIPYLMSLRKKKMSYNSICTRLNAIYHFYDMNDVTLNKKKIRMFKRVHYLSSSGRIYKVKIYKKIKNVVGDKPGARIRS